jgi:transcriptional regulator with XRE-family HTH domain
MAQLKYDYIKKSQIIGFKLRKARIDKGLSQQEVGAMLGISHAAIGSYERGRLRISVDLIAEFATIYERPISYFFEEDAEMVKKYEEYKSKVVPKYDLDENLEFSLEFSIKTYLKAYGYSDADCEKLTEDVLIFIKKHI